MEPPILMRITKSPTPLSVISQINPTQTAASHLLKIHFNIYGLSTPRSSKCSLSFSPPHKNPLCISLVSHMCHMPRPSHSFDFITRTIFGEQCRSQSSSLCSLLHSPVSSSLLSPNIPLNILFSNILSLCSSLNVSDQVSHPYRATDKIIFQFIQVIIIFG